MRRWWVRGARRGREKKMCNKGPTISSWVQVFYAPPIILECMVPKRKIGMDGPYVYNRDGWSPCVQ